MQILTRILDRLAIWYRRYIRRDCYACGGNGKTAQAAPETCDDCGGTGVRP
jgi:DnaJ-class molecular chaperone